MSDSHARPCRPGVKTKLYPLSVAERIWTMYHWVQARKGQA